MHIFGTVTIRNLPIVTALYRYYVDVHLLSDVIIIPYRIDLRGRFQLITPTQIVMMSMLVQVDRRRILILRQFLGAVGTKRLLLLLWRIFFERLLLRIVDTHD